MSTDTPSTTETAQGSGNLAFLAVLALLVGAVTGLVGAAFRLGLVEGDHLRIW